MSPAGAVPPGAAGEERTATRLELRCRRLLRILPAGYRAAWLLALALVETGAVLAVAVPLALRAGRVLRRLPRTAPRAGSRQP